MDLNKLTEEKEEAKENVSANTTAKKVEKLNFAAIPVGNQGNDVSSQSVSVLNTSVAMAGQIKNEFDEERRRAVVLNVTMYYDMLLIWWHCVYLPDFQNDYVFTAQHTNDVVTIKSSLNDPALDTSDLYTAYHGKLDHILDAKYVFEQVAHIPDSDRHFEFDSFSAHILFVLCKLGLSEFYDGDNLQMELAQWNEMIITKIQLYLLNTIKVDTRSYREINVAITNPVESTPQQERVYNLELLDQRIEVVINPNLPGMHPPMQHHHAPPLPHPHSHPAAAGDHLLAPLMQSQPVSPHGMVGMPFSDFNPNATVTATATAMEQQYVQSMDPLLDHGDSSLSTSSTSPHHGSFGQNRSPGGNRLNRKRRPRQNLPPRRLRGGVHPEDGTMSPNGNGLNALNGVHSESAVNMNTNTNMNRDDSKSPGLGGCRFYMKDGHCPWGDDCYYRDWHGVADHEHSILQQQNSSQTVNQIKSETATRELTTTTRMNMKRKKGDGVTSSNLINSISRTSPQRQISNISTSTSDTDLEPDSERESNSLSTPSVTNGGNEIYKMYRQKVVDMEMRKEEEEEEEALHGHLCTSTECVHLNWSEALHYYSTLNLKNESQRAEFRCFVQDRYESLLRDYVHILDHHHGGDLEMQMGEMKPCNEHNCLLLYRHHEKHRKLSGDSGFKSSESSGESESKVSTEDDDDDVLDNNMLFYRDLMDAMHCFVAHGYDIGFRIKVKPTDNSLINNIGTINDDMEMMRWEGDAQYAYICRIQCAKHEVYCFSTSWCVARSH